jgi:hypothetical protein
MDNVNANIHENSWLEKVDKTADVPTATIERRVNGVVVEVRTGLPVCPSCLHHECTCPKE